MLLLLQVTMNVHRDSEHRRDPFTWDEVRSWFGYAPTPVHVEPDVDALKDRMERFAQFWNALPEVPRTGYIPYNGEKV